MFAEGEFQAGGRGVAAAVHGCARLGGYSGRLPEVPLTLPAQRLRRLLAVYLLAVAFVTIVYATLNARAMHPWIDGEWLINYSAGLVRRGLLGEVLLLLSRGLHVPLFLLALVLQVAVYATLYVGVYRLSRGIRWSVLLIAAMVSPATLAFTVLDPPSSVRKEALLFSVLAIVLLALLAARQRRPTARAGEGVLPVAILLAVAAPVLVLTHEALLCYLPYLFAAPFLLVRSRRTALRMVVAPAVLALLATVLVVTHPGDRAQAMGICDSVGRSIGAQLTVTDLGGPCGGAIAYLGKDRDTARRDTMRTASVYSYRTRYPLPMLLSLAPAALLLARRLRRGLPEDRRATRTLVVCTAMALLASTPLFLVAMDWGRWTHLHATCLMLLLLAVERPQPGTPMAEATVMRAGLALAPDTGRRLAAGLALLLYATAWTLPAVGLFPGRFGYVDLFRYVTRYAAR